jgi:hypothetical protein
VSVRDGHSTARRECIIYKPPQRRPPSCTLIKNTYNSCMRGNARASPGARNRQDRGVGRGVEQGWAEGWSRGGEPQAEWLSTLIDSRKRSRSIRGTLIAEARKSFIGRDPFYLALLFLLPRCLPFSPYMHSDSFFARGITRIRDTYKSQVASIFRIRLSVEECATLTPTYFNWIVFRSSSGQTIGRLSDFIRGRKAG